MRVFCAILSFLDQESSGSCRIVARHKRCRLVGSQKRFCSGAASFAPCKFRSTFSNSRADSAPHSRGRMCPSHASFASLEKQEGAGKAGCRPHPLPASNKKSWRQSPQAWPNIRPSLRNGVTAYSALSPGTGLSCPRRSRASSAQELGLSVGRSGPHAFAVRADDARLASSSRPSHPALHVRDDA